MAARKKVEKNDQGQAIFEFIVFLPFLLLLFVGVVKTAGSINASINQQKAVRGYLFHLLQNNSKVRGPHGLRQLEGFGLRHLGFVSIGWREKSEGSNSLATCFQLPSFLRNSSIETCEQPTEEDKKSNFLRIYTVFGICSATYVLDPGISGANRWREGEPGHDFGNFGPCTNEK